jgi:hypothetical protein
VTHAFDDANHMDELMAVLCKHAGAIAALAPMMSELRERHVLGDVYFAVAHHGEIDTAWFAAHLGHRLVPISEYGHLLNQCTEYVTCMCGERHRCTKDYGHEGDHVVTPR